MLCESQTSIDLDGFETIDVRSIDLQETNTAEQDGGACGNCGEDGHNARTCKNSQKVFAKKTFQRKSCSKNSAAFKNFSDQRKLKKQLKK